MQALSKLFKRCVPKSVFAKGVVTLMTGTGLAQALPIIASPILTRLYTPEEFGIFALYVSVCAILAVLVTGKYEVAVVTSRNDVEAINLVVLTLGISLLVSAAILGAVIIWHGPIVRVTGHPQIGPWLYVIPLTTLIIGCYHALNYWLNRRIRYRSMAGSRVAQSGASVTVQLAAGASKAGLSGLILGQMCGQILATLFLAKALNRDDRKLFQRVSVKRMYVVARKYIQYPKYMVPGQVLSVGATELPLVLLTLFFGASVSGFYSLAYRVMAAPLSLVASAVGDVYRQKASEQYAVQGECLDVFLMAFKRLLLFAFLPTLPVLLFGPELFSLVFGESWREAGEVASLLSVLVFFQTVSSPLSTTILLPGWLAMEFVWQFARLSLGGGVFYLCYRADVGYELAIMGYVSLFAFLYLVHSYVQYKAAQGKL